MEPKTLPTKLRDGIGVLLLVCLGVRIGAWLIEPVLPLLGGMFVFVLIVWWFLSGPRAHH